MHNTIGVGLQAIAVRAPVQFVWLHKHDTTTWLFGVQLWHVRLRGHAGTNK
jgi:hypothetical protein